MSERSEPRRSPIVTTGYRTAALVTHIGRARRHDRDRDPLGGAPLAVEVA